MIGNRFIQSIK